MSTARRKWTIMKIGSTGRAVVAFREKIEAPALLGGALIVAGGTLLTFWQPG